MIIDDLEIAIKKNDRFVIKVQKGVFKVEDRKGKIGLNTALLVINLIIFSPAIRMFGTYTTNAARQAAWLSPAIASIVCVYLVYMLNTLLVNHPGLSLIQIYEKIAGKLLAKIIASVYLIWIINLLGGYGKMYTSRLTTVLYPNIQENLFLIITLFIIGTLFIKAGLVVASRMFLVFFWVVSSGFIVISCLLIPNIKLENLTPISYLDILPVAKGSIGILGIFAYFTIMFIMSDNIIGMKEFKKRSLQSFLFLFICATVLIASEIGISGSYLISKSTLSYLVTVEQIILLNSFTGIESILIILWILSDFAILTVLVFASLMLIKYILSLEDTSLYKNIFMIMIFFVTNLITNNYYTTQEYANKYVYITNIILFIAIPIAMAWIYKIRMKASKALKSTQKL